MRVEAGSELPELVMEYLPTTLRHCLDMHGALPAEIGGGILLEVALGLRYLHEFSPPIIHRDLSSNNVLLTTSMSAKISDLGVAKILDVSPGRAAQMTQTQGPGTPAFMPPEAILARPKYTSKVDIFSIGVLVVHTLSGEWPTPGGVYVEDPNDSGKTIPVNEFERRRESIDKIREGHPLLGLIEKCLSNVASCRPDAAEVVRQLQAEHARVPPRPENRLELLQQNQSLRAELQQTSREENEALRREIGIQRIEVEALRRENETMRADMARMNAEIALPRQNSLAQRSRYESEHGNFPTQRATLQEVVRQLQAEHARVPPRPENRLELLQNQSLRAELQQTSREENEALRREIGIQRIEIEALRRENETMRADVARMNAEIALPRQNSLAQRSRYESEHGNFPTQRATLQREVEDLPAELALRVERSQSKTESVGAQVQRLTMQTNSIQVRIAKIKSLPLSRFSGMIIVVTLRQRSVMMSFPAYIQWVTSRGYNFHTSHRN